MASLDASPGGAAPRDPAFEMRRYRGEGGVCDDEADFWPDEGLEREAATQIRRTYSDVEASHCCYMPAPRGLRSNGAQRLVGRHAVFLRREMLTRGNRDTIP